MIDVNPQQEYWKQITEQYQNLLKESGIVPDEHNIDEIEDAFGFTPEELGELERETIQMLTTKTIRVKKVNPDAILPEYAYPTDSGFDLYSTIDYELPSLGRALIPTGISVQFDENLELQVRPKSGLAIKLGLTVLNTPGTVDQGYSGEIKVIVFNASNETISIKKGMKIAQGVLCPVMNGKYVKFDVVDELNENDRGDKGFGSTGI